MSNDESIDRTHLAFVVISLFNTSRNVWKSFYWKLNLQLIKQGETCNTKCSENSAENTRACKHVPTIITHARYRSGICTQCCSSRCMVHDGLTVLQSCPRDLFRTRRSKFSR